IQLAAAVAANRHQGQVGIVGDRPLPGALHQQVDLGGTLGQQAIDALALVEAGGECRVGRGELGPRGRGPVGVLLLSGAPRVPGAGGVLPGVVTPRAGRVPRGHRSLSSPGVRVRISTPSAVTTTVCSHCAESERSLVTTVQPSGNTRVWRLPALIIGSMVKVMPSCSTTPSPGRP